MSAIIGLLLRHLLTAAGAVLIQQGLADSGAVESISGGVMALVGVIASYANKKRLGAIK